MVCLCTRHKLCRQHLCRERFCTSRTLHYNTGVVRMKHKLHHTYWLTSFNESFRGIICRALPPMSVLPQVHASLPHTQGSMPHTMTPHGNRGKIAESFDSAPQNQRFLIVLMDHHTGFPEVKATGSVTSTSIVAWLRETFAVFRYPAKFLADNGPQFVSKEFE